MTKWVNQRVALGERYYGFERNSNQIARDKRQEHGRIRENCLGKRVGASLSAFWLCLSKMRKSVNLQDLYFPSTFLRAPSSKRRALVQSATCNGTIRHVGIARAMLPWLRHFFGWILSGKAEHGNRPPASRTKCNDRTYQAAGIPELDGVGVIGIRAVKLC